MANRLFLLDALALIYRAHFALIRSPIFTKGGVNTSALYGFTNSLVDLLKSRGPTHIAVVFDTPEPTSRHKEFEEYKAQREEMPEDIDQAIPNVKRLAEAFRIPVLEAPGYEADDIIGTLAKRAENAKEDYEIYMVTPDKDFAQLVSEKTYMFKPGRSGGDAEVIGVPEVLEKWEVERPEQVIDILGLWGDASDNIPGIPGIGEKTAKKLIKAYGSVEGLLEHSGELKGKQKENVEKFGERGLLSKRLATIILDVPVDVSLDDLKLAEPDETALKNLFVEFEFNSLGKRLFGKEFKAGRGFGTTEAAPAGEEEQGEIRPDLKTIADVEHEYHLIASAEERSALLSELEKRKAFCFDLETSSLDPRTADVVGMAFSWSPHKASYVAVTAGEEDAILEEFRGVLADDRIEKTGHNLKFDLGVLLAKGVEAGGPFLDTMLVDSIVEPDHRHGMDHLSEQYLGYTPVSIESLIGSKADRDGQLSMLAVTGEKPEEVADYAAEDADVTWQLAEKLRTRLEESGQENVYYDIEAPLLPVLVRMENEGIAIDIEALGEISEMLGKRIADLEAEIQRQAGTEFNVNSPKQLGEVLFDDLKLVEKPKKTKTGQYKTDEQTLSRLATEHKIVRDLLDYREAAKLKNTYVDALPEAVCAKTGRVHTTFHQLMTATGRLASSNPNLQNIPVRSAQGREIRKAFVPRDENYLLLSADYSQIELRIMAELSHDRAMLEAFEEGLDIHTATAAKVYGVGLDVVIPEMRRSAKMVNFGIIYGISAFGLSQRLGIPRGEAAGIIEEYFKQYPAVKKFMDGCIAGAREKGYVETITGRRRYLRDINSANANVRGAAERTAINTPIQGSAADMIKIAMCRVDAALRAKDLKSKMLLQVHDELVFDLRKGEEEVVRSLVEKSMKKAIPLSVPIVVDSGIGKNWLEAH